MRFHWRWSWHDAAGSALFGFMIGMWLERVIHSHEVAKARRTSRIA